MAGHACGVVRAAPPAFTLIEMMVVMFISLAMMVLVVPIFSLSIKTVKSVERKLEVQEASRMALDLLDQMFQAVVFDSRGNHFSLRHKSFPSNDPITVPGAQPFSQSLRRADSSAFLALPAAKLDKGDNRPFAACYYAPDPLLRSFGDATPPRTDVMWVQPYAALQRIAYRDPCIDTAVEESHIRVRYSDMKPDRTASGKYTLNTLGVGHETFTILDTSESHPNEGSIFPRFYAIDLAFDYWDDAERKFKQLNEGEACYFAPPPKALRATLTFLVIHYDKNVEGVGIRTPQKSSRMTVSRIFWLPASLGDGVVSGTTNSYTDPLPYNKHINILVADKHPTTSKTLFERKVYLEP
jgi:type II secretory pathway pseudopilin PulG